MADNVTDSVVGEVTISLTIGQIIENNGERRPATVKRTVPIKGKDIETRGLSGAVLTALNRVRDDVAGLVASE